MFSPGVAVRMVAIALPETELIALEDFETAYPLHAFPRVEVRNNEAEGTPMVGGERLAIVFKGEEDVGTQEVSKRNVGSVALLGEEESELRVGFGPRALKDFGEEHAFPTIVEAAPARDTVEVAGGLGLRKGAELVPSKA